MLALPREIHVTSRGKVFVAFCHSLDSTILSVVYFPKNNEMSEDVHMKITIIGSSHGGPEPNRRCSSIMIQTGGTIYFVDMGTPVNDDLRRRGYPVEDVRGVFISHMHGDHTNGLIQFVYHLNNRYTKADPAIYLPDMDAVEVFDRWLQVTVGGKRRQLRYRPVEAGVIYDDGTLRVTAIPNQHIAVSYSYLLEAEGKRVLITGDLKNPKIDFPVGALSAPLDLVVSECAHFPAGDYLPLYENIDIRKVCITHYTNRFLETIFTLQRTLEEIGTPMLVATDGLEIDV